MENKEFIKPQEIAEKLKLSLKTIYNYINNFKNEIRTLKQGKIKYISIKDFKIIYDRENPEKSPNSDFCKIENQTRFFMETINNYKIAVNSYKNELENQKKEYEIKIDRLDFQKSELLIVYLKTIKKYYFALILAVIFFVCLAGVVVFLYFLTPRLKVNQF